MSNYEFTTEDIEQWRTALLDQQRKSALSRPEWTVVYRDSWGEYCGIPTREDGTELAGITIEEAAAYVVANGPSHTIEWAGTPAAH